MILTLQRTHAIGPRTFGTMHCDGQFMCYVLEDQVREVPGQPVASWKIKGVTAIPSSEHVGGPYAITLEHSPRFGPDTLTVRDVPGFTGVRMHAGNTELDTEGCPLLGLAIDVRGIVGGTSRNAVALVREAVRQGRMDGETVLMYVVNAVVVA